MRNLITLFGALLFLSMGLNAQNTAKNIKVHKVWVTLLDNPQIIKGYLYSADEISIKITNTKSWDSLSLKTIDSKNIDMIKIRRKGEGFKSVGIGALSGLVVGAVFGAIGKSSPFVSKSNNIVYGAANGAITGAGVGLVAKKKKVEISIRGDITYFEKVYKKLQLYSFKSNAKG
jgi:outer membrane lipoprotein SlyB